MTQKKSKSKTFQRGTDPDEMQEWLAQKIFIDFESVSKSALTEFKYLITITKIEDRKEEK